MTTLSDDPREIVHIYRWDLDKTYIKTEFETWRGLLHIVFQKPEDKTNIPGAVSLLRELGREHEDERVVITFVSGSPTQMRDRLLRKFELDGIKPDLLVLKPIVQNILRGRFRAVKGQVGYKLGALLDVRNLTTTAPETLFGDDAEMDALIYSMYADIVAGRMDIELLHQILVEAEVYTAPMQQILTYAQTLQQQDTVGRIFINLEGRTAPGRFLPFGPRVVPIVNYFQAALVLWSDRVLPLPGVVRVAAGMLERDNYGLFEFANSFQDLIRRRVLGSDALEQLEAEAKDVDFSMLPPQLADRFVARVRALAPRTRVEARQFDDTMPDYLEILRSDRALKKRVTEVPRRLF